MAETENRIVSRQPDAAERAIKWIAGNKNRITTVLGTVVLLAGATWYLSAAKARKEQFANRQLAEARFTAQSGNLQLATSDLTSIVESYGGTPAGQEAVLVLANVRLAMDEGELAVAELTEFLNGNPLEYFEGPGYALLAGAYEELGRFQEASESYEKAADATDLPLLRGEFLLDQARTATVAGNRTVAIEVYELILEEFDRDSPINIEASARLSEARQQAS